MHETIDKIEGNVATMTKVESEEPQQWVVLWEKRLRRKLFLSPSLLYSLSFSRLSYLYYVMLAIVKMSQLCFPDKVCSLAWCYSIPFVSIGASHDSKWTHAVSVSGSSIADLIQPAII